MLNMPLINLNNHLETRQWKRCPEMKQFMRVETNIGLYKINKRFMTHRSLAEKKIAPDHKP